MAEVADIDAGEEEEQVFEVAENWCEGFAKIAS